MRLLFASRLPTCSARLLEPLSWYSASSLSFHQTPSRQYRKIWGVLMSRKDCNKNGHSALNHCSLVCWSFPLAFRLAGQPATPSTPPATLAHAIAPRAAAHPRQGQIRLGLRVDSRHRPVHRRRTRRANVQGTLAMKIYSRTRPRHHQFARDCFRPRRAREGGGAERVPSNFPQTRLGRARCRGHLENPTRHRSGRAEKSQAHRPPNCRHRHHQPTRDHPAVGSPNRPAYRQRHRVAGPPHRQGMRPTQSGRPTPPPSAAKPASSSTPIFPPPKSRGSSST